MMDLSGAVAALGTPAVITVERRSRTFDAANGNADITVDANLTLTASVQPAGGRELRRLPENLRTREAVVLYTTAALRVSDSQSGAMADLVTYAGRVYEVQRFHDWMASAGYGQAIATAVEV